MTTIPDATEQMLHAATARADAAEAEVVRLKEQWDSHMKWIHLPYECAGSLSGGLVCRNGVERDGERCHYCSHIIYLAERMAPIEAALARVTALCDQSQFIGTSHTPITRTEDAWNRALRHVLAAIAAEVSS